MTGHWNSNSSALQAEKNIGSIINIYLLADTDPPHFHYRKYLHVLFSLWPECFFLLGWSGTKSTLTEATAGLLYKPWMMIVKIGED
jgi:hypothetical protein